MLLAVTPRVYYMPFEKEQNRPSLGFLRGDRFCLMIDAGNTPLQATSFLGELSQMGFPAPSFVALTHSHWDHSFGLSALPFPSIACLQTRRSLEKVSRLSWTPQAMELNAEKGIIPSMIVPAIQNSFPDSEKIRIVLPNIVFEESLTLHLGHCTCILRHVPSPHAPDTVIAYIPEEGMVFLGDAIYQKPVGDVWLEEPEKLRGLLEILEQIDFSVGLPAHQNAMSKVDLLAWLRHRLKKEEDI